MPALLPFAWTRQSTRRHRRAQPATARDEYEQRPARDAERDARCFFQKQACSPAASARLLGTSSRRRSSRPARSCSGRGAGAGRPRNQRPARLRCCGKAAATSRPRRGPTQDLRGDEPCRSVHRGVCLRYVTLSGSATLIETSPPHSPPAGRGQRRGRSSANRGGTRAGDGRHDRGRRGVRRCHRDCGRGGRWVRVRDPPHAVLIQAAARQQGSGFRCGLGPSRSATSPRPRFPERVDAAGAR